ncbi:hypothetical protein [Desulfofustis limnaeus]|uniref:tRNA(Ile2) 2-agmatinylcytidine synthetase n=1 Tax=Desulfofustis limnaeus TaxID=2740163 RepID=A0ABM7W962_9BACT|nr:hypothetical protein [Desulfofustis limnaeus]MDX9894873.1 hypothetical protein [Desulfofustis sp.]BDD87467.1 hypothetical protein DPPLL_18320 [Desulfofustis limnaeus]
MTGTPEFHLLIGIDDTDNADSPGSGSLAEALARDLFAKGLADCGPISRHQLFVDDRIAYTSHNSAMCFSAVTGEASVPSVVDYCQAFLRHTVAAGSDPGLCVADVLGLACEKELVEFGRQAKQAIMDKRSAYLLAAQAGVHLSEHGGTGDGVIGSLAAVGLRLSGGDGRFRGWHHVGETGASITVQDLCNYPFIDGVCGIDGSYLEPSEQIEFGPSPLKTVCRDGRQVLLVTARSGDADPRAPLWTTMHRSQMKCF